MEDIKGSYDNPQPKKRVCFNCNSDQCFMEKLHGEETLMCFTCGYMTTENYKKSNLQFQSQIMNTAQLVRDLMKVDEETKLCWLPSVLTTKKGMIFPEGNVDDWHWSFSPLTKIEKEEQNKYLKADGTPYQERLAVEKKETFPKDKFIDACRAMGIVVGK
jgi:hypothetical protein